MLAMFIKARVKPEGLAQFLAAVEIDTQGSEDDEPGCLRFNVLKDAVEENVYYFYEIYKDEAALEVHRTTPHFKAWEAAAETLDGPPEVIRCETVFPASPDYWR